MNGILLALWDVLRRVTASCAACHERAGLVLSAQGRLCMQRMLRRVAEQRAEEARREAGGKRRGTRVRGGRLEPRWIVTERGDDR